MAMRLFPRIKKAGQPELIQFESIEKGSEQTGTFWRHSSWGGQVAPLGYGSYDVLFQPTDTRHAFVGSRAAPATEQ